MKIKTVYKASIIVCAAYSGHAAMAAQNKINGFDKKIWAATVQSLSERSSITTLDRDSGLIISDTSNIDAGFNNRFMQTYVQKPTGVGGFLATWNGLRVQLTAYVNEVAPGRSTVRVEAQYSGFESNVSHSWVSLQSNDSLEQQVLSSIKSKMALAALVVPVPVPVPEPK